MYLETRLLPFSLNTFVGFPEAILPALPGYFMRTEVNAIKTVRLLMDERDVWGFEGVIGMLRSVRGIKRLELVCSDGSGDDEGMIWLQNLMAAVDKKRLAARRLQVDVIRYDQVEAFGP